MSSGTLVGPESAGSVVQRDVKSKRPELVGISGSCIINRLLQGAARHRDDPHRRRVARARYIAQETPAQCRRAVEEPERMIVLMLGSCGPQSARLMRAHMHGKKPVIEAAFGTAGAQTALPSDRTR